MGATIRFNGFVFFLIVVVFLICQPAMAECPECNEVAKGKIPAKFLDPSLKRHPSGFAIWDVEDAVKALKDKKGKYLWVDTRPKSFLKIGTVKDAFHLVCDRKGTTVPEEKHGTEITRERLIDAVSQIDPNLNAVTIVFFCQGPLCHRSYNAALRAIAEYGMNPATIVWFRAGYPNLEKHITENPRLKRRISRYLQGEIVNG